jgi:hypothetical protein
LGRGTADYKFLPGGPASARRIFGHTGKIFLDPKRLIFPSCNRRPCSVFAKGACAAGVLKIRAQYGDNFFPDIFLEYRKHQFYPAFKITGHPVGAGKVYLAAASGGKIKNPGMFKIAVYDAYYLYGFGKALNAGDEHTDAPDIKPYGNACPGSPVQGLDDIGVCQGIHFCHDEARRFLGRTPGLPLDEAKEPVL